ncbi:hypothetical protein AGMMS49941_05630 [Deferribacterales bacterium]|nr:hypothetical protein AGMMS49941_05630 [Deferribacterales bacterium]
MEYSAVDVRGKTVPSMLDNPLQKSMVEFIQLIFMKLLTSMDERYEIVIYIPIFSESGQVHTQRESYAELTLDRGTLVFSKSRSGSYADTNIATAINYSIGMNNLFKAFPH